VGARCPDGKATVGEGRRIGKGKQRADGVVDAPAVVACDSGERKYRCIFFFEKSHHTEGGAEEACWVGLRTSRPDGARSDGRSNATIIVFYFHNI
jgi:hypothetical protein